MGEYLFPSLSFVLSRRKIASLMSGIRDFAEMWRLYVQPHQAHPYHTGRANILMIAQQQWQLAWLYVHHGLQARQALPSRLLHQGC
jgi:hypothetical protein